MGKKPAIGVIRNMARSGGTLIGKCIGCMDGVMLLSEIHPGNLQVTNPMMQAHKWFGLVTQKDLARWKQARGPTMLQFVHTCDQRARAGGGSLVLRDWSHLDYLGRPFVEPGLGFALGEALGGAYEIKQICTTRHPVDQYLSMQSFPGMEGMFTVGEHLRGCLAFARYAVEHGFVRYEDFTGDPDAALMRICDAIGVRFDPGYRDRWHGYTTITGDNAQTGGRSASEKEIRSLPRKPVDPAIMDAFRACPEYGQACALLGYEE